MERVIRINDLSEIYDAGVKTFAESLLKSKARKGESVVYSVGGQIVQLKASDALWIYERLSNGLEDWEVSFLSKKAEKGEDMHYRLEDDQTLVIPARLVLDLFEHLSDSDKPSKWHSAILNKIRRLFQSAGKSK
jgi:hypothetical protein